MMTPSVLIEHLHVDGAGPTPGLPLLATATLYVAVAAAGLLAAPALTGVDDTRRSRAAATGVVGAAYVGLLVALTATGQLDAARFAVAAAAAIGAAGTLSRAPRARLVAAAAVVGSQLLLPASSDSGTHRSLIGVHLVAAAVWLGGTAHLALLASGAARRSVLGAAIRRFTRYAVSSAAILVGSGYALLLAHRLGLLGLPHSTFGRVVLVKAGLLAAAGMLGLAHRRAVGVVELRRQPRLVAAEAAVLATALGFAVVLSGTALPVSRVQSPTPGLAVVNFGPSQLGAVFVTATSPTEASVRVVSDESMRVVDRRTDQAFQLNPGEVARMSSRGGSVALALTSGLSTVDVDVRPTPPTGASGDASVTADPSGWLDYQLGYALGRLDGGTARSRHLACGNPSTRVEGVGLGRQLRRHRVGRIAVVSDGSDRAFALIRGLAAAHVQRTSAPDTLSILIATDATKARAELVRIARADRTVQAVYLAPWLLDGRVLSLLASLRLPQIIVASDVDAMSPLADRFRAALSTFANGVAPSIAGLLGYSSAVAPAGLPANQLTLYSATPIGFLPGVLNVGHDHSDEGWFPGGTLVPTSAAYRLPVTPCPAPSI